MKRNLAIDAARGSLAWAVVFVHILWFSGLQHSGARGAIGSWAVIGFMILSGYVATAAYKPEPYSRYLAKRFWRLTPVLAACWVLALLAGSGLDTAWFVTLLVQFYLVLPFLMNLTLRHGRGVLVWLFALGLFCYLPPIRDFFEPLAPMYEFLPQNLLWFVLGMIGYELADPYVMANLSARCEGHWLLVRLGEISYSTYLVHWPLLFAIGHIIPVELPTALRMALIALAGVPATLVMSLILYKFVELPGVALGKRRLARKPSILPAKEVPA